MRLVAWNTNCENRTKRSFADILALTAPLHPDVLVISGAPRVVDGALWHWEDDAAATRLALWVRPDWSARVRLSDMSVPHSAVLEIDAPLRFSVIGIYAETRADGLTYAKILQQAVVAYGDAMAGPRTMLVGDLNSSTRVSGQERSHPKFVSLLAEPGLTSLLHHQEDVAHGEERTGTFRRGDKEWCIDYAFVSADLLSSATIAVPRHAMWRNASDHLPLIIDIPDACLSDSQRL